MEQNVEVLWFKLGWDMEVGLQDFLAAGLFRVWGFGEGYFESLGLLDD